MDSIRRDRSFNAMGVSEETKQLLQHLDSRQAILRAVLDEVWVNGEGELNGEQEDFLRTDLHAGKYEWIRVYTDSSHTKAIATFYLWTVNGVLERMWLARARKNMPPNPLDEIAESSFIPAIAEEQEGDKARPHKKTALSSTHRDHRGAQGIQGMKPTLSVKRIKDPDNDHKWQFPNFPVRSSILAPALMEVRGRGFQKIGLDTLRLVIQARGERR